MNKLWFKIKVKILFVFFQKVRILFYAFISNHPIDAKKLQPVLANGEGSIVIGKNVVFGVRESPYFYSGYTYLDARKKESRIIIGDNCFINNSACMISDGKSITIGDNCLIGVNFQVIDSDFHDLDPAQRFGGKNILKKDVVIENNVFISNNVTVLKGVSIGTNSVLGSGCVVTKDIPSNVIVAGNPAKVIKTL